MSGVILQIWKRKKFWPFYSLLEYSWKFLYILCKTILPELEKWRSGTVLGDNFSHISLQDDPCMYSFIFFIHTVYCSFSISVKDIVAILISFEKGKELVDMLKNHNIINITITHVPKEDDPPDSPGQLNNTSVLFVSISFIVLIIISLAWLVFYYIQRCRYTNAKERLSVSSYL